MPIKGYFRRTDSTPIRIRPELTGPVIVVKQDDVIQADIETFKDMIGFVYVGQSLPSKVISTDPLKPTSLDEFDNMVVVQAERQNIAPHKLFLEQKKKEESVKAIVKEAVKYTEIEAEKPPVVPENAPIDKEKDRQAIVEYLKKFDNKKWFVMKKEDARSYLERLGVDYSNLPNSKNEFIKLLKEHIQSVS